MYRDQHLCWCQGMSPGVKYVLLVLLYASQSDTLYFLVLLVTRQGTGSLEILCADVRDPGQIPDLIQASPVLLDVVNGSVEYDVFAKGPGSVDVRNLTAPFDQQCPQAAPFGLLRCTGHQHIGAHTFFFAKVDSQGFLLYGKI